MSLQVVKNAFSFAWQELKSRPVTWFGLALFSTIAMIAGQVVFFVWDNFFATLDIAQWNKYWIALLVVGQLVFLYFILYWMIALASVLTGNMLDAVQKKPLRMLRYIVHGHTLVWAPTLAFLLSSLFLISAGIVLYMIVLFGIKSWMAIVALRFVGLVFLLTYFYYGLRYLFVGFVVLDENVGVRLALSKSWKLTQGNVLTLLFFLGMLGLFGSILGLCAILFSFVFSKIIIISMLCFMMFTCCGPMTSLALTSVYQQLKDQKKS